MFSEGFFHTVIKSQGRVVNLSHLRHFPFFLTVFKSPLPNYCQNLGLYGKGLRMSKVKESADNKVNALKNDIIRKGESSDYQHFLRLPQGFKVLFL